VTGYWAKTFIGRVRKPTPRSIARTGYRVHVGCKSCRHAKDADLAALVDGAARIAQSGENPGAARAPELASAVMSKNAWATFECVDATRNRDIACPRYWTGEPYAEAGR
jgi:hypothetical protein